MRWNEDPRKEESTGEPRQDIRDKMAFAPPGQGREHKKRAPDGDAKAASFASRQSSWCVFCHSSEP